MALSLTTAANVLKNFYLPKIQEQLNQKSVLYDRLKKYQETVDGKNYTYALHTSRNVSAGTGMAEGGAFPTAGNQGYTSALVPEQQIAASLEITGRAIKSTKTDAGSYIRGIKSEVDGVQRDFVRAINRQFHSDGTDALAFWTSADDVSGTVLDDAQGNAFVHLQNTTTADLIDASDDSSLLGTAIVVTLGAENASTFSVTWSGSVSGSADGDYLILSGTKGLQLMGIKGIISASNPPFLPNGLQGLPVSTNSFWKAQSFTNSGTLRDLTLELMQKPLSRISRNSDFSADDVEFLMANTGVHDKYIALLVADKRHVNTMTLDGGQTSVDFNGKPIIIDPQCRENVLYYIVPDSMDFLTSSNGVVFADFADGSMWQKKPSTSTYADAYLAFMVLYGNLACKSRNANGILTDLTI
jgi:hypothetical protein